MLKFDGSSIKTTARAKVVIQSLIGIKTTLAFNLDFDCNNNQAEYKALIIGLEILLDLKAKKILVLKDSQLVLKQLTREYMCTSFTLVPYYNTALQLLVDFQEVELKNVP